MMRSATGNGHRDIFSSVQPDDLDTEADPEYFYTNISCISSYSKDIGLHVLLYS